MPSQLSTTLTISCYRAPCSDVLNFKRGAGPQTLPRPALLTFQPATQAGQASAWWASWKLQLTRTRWTPSPLSERQQPWSTDVPYQALPSCLPSEQGNTQTPSTRVKLTPPGRRQRLNSRDRSDVRSRTEGEIRKSKRPKAAGRVLSLEQVGRPVDSFTECAENVTQATKALPASGKHSET